MDNPLLTMLGRRGRAAVIAALAAAPEAAWQLRDLAAAANVDPVVASRTVKELAALGAVEALRPGRAAVIRWQADAASARFLAGLEVPDLRGDTLVAFRAGFGEPAGVQGVTAGVGDGSAAGDPLAPTRITIHVAGDDEAAWDAVGPALDAVRAAALPGPEVDVVPADDGAGDGADGGADRGADGG